jgi:hypothetical protein
METDKNEKQKKSYHSSVFTGRIDSGGAGYQQCI